MKASNQVCEVCVHFALNPLRCREVCVFISWVQLLFWFIYQSYSNALIFKLWPFQKFCFVRPASVEDEHGIRGVTWLVTLIGSSLKWHRLHTQH
jgi:hypothetical protein